MKRKKNTLHNKIGVDANAEEAGKTTGQALTQCLLPYCCKQRKVLALAHRLHLLTCKQQNRVECSDFPASSPN